MRENPLIQQVCNEIVDQFHPEKIILFSCKFDLEDEVTSFKLVVVAENEDGGLEHDIYLAIDCDIPYDVVVYTPENWAQLREIPHSFANRVNQSGVVLYG